MSNFFKENILYILAFLFAFIVVMWALNFLPSVKELYDTLKIKLPIFHRINMAIFTSRFCRSLGLLLASGSDSLSALENLKKTITNRYLSKQFDKVVANVQMGMSLSSALSSEMGLSPVLIQMIIVGERTGDLAPILNRTAPYFDAQAEASLNLITTIVQPTIMLLLGASVAVLFIAIYSPILQMITELQI
jgi:type II secretory pathway component PulF